MPVKTILLHMTDDERNGTRLALAAGLARRFQAFVDVVYIATPIDAPSAIGVHGDKLADMADATVAAQHNAAQAELETRRVLKDRSYSWTVAEGDPIEVLSARSIVADLAIVTVPDPDLAADWSRQHLHDRLPILAACPVLVVPRDLPAEAAVGRHIVIGWRAMREASVAVRAALPMLAAAQKVTVLSLESGGAAVDPVSEILLYLSRHGIEAHHESRPHVHGDVGEALLGAVAALGGDLLVMGAYGHSRLREIMLGSATRTVLRHLDVPVLMAH